MFAKVFAFIFFGILFFQGCGSTKETPVVSKPTPVIEKNLTQTKTPQPSLYVIAPKGASVKILNIKPKYYDGIELQNGDYLIEVTKDGYERYKKWLKIEKPTTLKVSLQKRFNLPPFEWRYDHQPFYTLYDPKTDLIWALPSEYVDYVQKQQPKEFLPKTIDAVAREWPRIEKTKLDTFIYNGTNSLTLYTKSRRNSQKEYFTSLDTLTLNGLKQKWRVPTKEELQRNNPFKEYQQYYQLIWNKGNIIKMNVPLLCSLKTSKGKNYHSVIGYKKNKQLYNGKSSQFVESIKHPQNIALITPVRKKDAKLDPIIYSKSTNNEKFLKLYKELQSGEKTVKTLFGDPKIKNISYDKKRKRLQATLYSTTNSFEQKFSLKVARKNYPQLKEALLDERVIPLVKLRVNDGVLLYESLKLVNNKKEGKQAYLEAKRSKNINFYREYIRLFPDTKEAKELQKLIDKEYKSKYSAS